MRLYLKHRIHFKTTNSGLGNSPKHVKRGKKEKDKKKKKKKKKTPGRSENNPIEIIDSSSEDWHSDPISRYHVPWDLRDRMHPSPAA